MQCLPAQDEITESWQAKKGAPVVSIACITYNHASYIEDCLAGFLKQKTQFPFEILVHDDASTDGTASILQAYQKKYPEIVRLKIQTSNIYSRSDRHVWQEVAPLLRGRYVATCEGDDYWNDPLKLQKQKEILDKNPKIMVSYHDANIIDEEGHTVSQSKLLEKWKKDFTQDELRVAGVLLLFPTLMYRNIIREWPNEFLNVKNGDRVRAVLFSEHGGGSYSQNVLPSTYRLHGGSSWSSLDRQSQDVTNLETDMQIYNYLKRINGNVEAQKFLYDVLFKRVYYSWKDKNPYFAKAARYQERVEKLKVKVDRMESELKRYREAGVVRKLKWALSGKL